MQRCKSFGKITIGSNMCIYFKNNADSMKTKYDFHSVTVILKINNNNRLFYAKYCQYHLPTSITVIRKPLSNLLLLMESPFKNSNVVYNKRCQMSKMKNQIRPINNNNFCFHDMD